MTKKSCKVLQMRERCEIINRNLKNRVDKILPMIMQETDIDMWLIICQEDNLDPVFQTMIPMDTWCPILQILVFFNRGNGDVERINLSRSKFGDIYDVPYTVKMPDQQWGWLREVIEARDPQKIAINQGEVAWAADGLSATLKEKLIASLPQKYVDRLVSAETLSRRWLETLSEDELEHFGHVSCVAHAIIREVYSRNTIIPGVTTVNDLIWAYWQLCADLGLDVSFKPAYRIVRSTEMMEKFGPQDTIIRAGDLIHCDVGMKYLRLITDNQEWAYVLRPGEANAPQGIKEIMKNGNWLQDIFMGEFIQGRTGNQILRAALKKARDCGLNNPRIYSHSCGLLLHEPGPLMGHPFEQDNYPGRGDVPLNYDSTFVAELSVDGVVPEWGNQTIRMSMEEQIMFTRNGAQFIDGRQTTPYLI